MVGSFVVAVVLCAAVWVPALARSSNCGGNSAALAACKSVYVCFRLVAYSHGDRAVTVTELNAADRGYFNQVTGLSWIPASKILVTRAKVAVGEASGRQVIAVCDTAFDNVPRRLFGRAPRTHAVAYADGSTGLLSVADFLRLDLRGFVDVRTIQNGKVEPDGPANRNLPVIH
jgi:hypothetical protein